MIGIRGHVFGLFEMDSFDPRIEPTSISLVDIYPYCSSVMQISWLFMQSFSQLLFLMMGFFRKRVWV